MWTSKNSSAIQILCQIDFRVSFQLWKWLWNCRLANTLTDKSLRETKSKAFKNSFFHRFTHNYNILTTFSYESSAWFEGSKRSETASIDYAIETSALWSNRREERLRLSERTPLSDVGRAFMHVGRGKRLQRPTTDCKIVSSDFLYHTTMSACFFYGCSFPKYCLVEQALLLRFKEENHKRPTEKTQGIRRFISLDGISLMKKLHNFAKTKSSKNCGELYFTSFEV